MEALFRGIVVIPGNGPGITGVIPGNGPGITGVIPGNDPGITGVIPNEGGLATMAKTCSLRSQVLFYLFSSIFKQSLRWISSK